MLKRIHLSWVFALEGDENELQGQAEADGEQIDVEILAPEDDAEIEGQDIDRGDAGSWSSRR